MDTEIVTERLTLRRTRPEDLDALHALASDFEVVKQTSTWPWPPDRAFTATRAVPMAPEIGMGGPVFAGDELVGMMGVSVADGTPGLGYMFARAHWGRGFATERGRRSSHIAGRGMTGRRSRRRCCQATRPRRGCC